MKFNRKRYPSDNYVQERNRVQSYWKYLNSVSEIHDKAQVVPNNPEWRKLNTAHDADYEAKYMNHSIGHSWDKYSRIGDIFSLRDENNIPLVTALVKDGIIIHAREEYNIRLSDENMEKMRTFANNMGFSIVEEKHPVDIFLDEENPNTKIKYILRNGNEKRVHEVVLEGRIKMDDINNLFNCLQNSKYFSPIDCHIPSIDGKNTTHELLCISHTPDLPTNEFFFSYVPVSYIMDELLNNSPCHTTPSMS